MADATNYAYDASFSETSVTWNTRIAGFPVSHEEPFGDIVRSSGTLADDNPFRFSTKYCDNETGIYWYGYRYYHPELGRWLSRDPIGEEAFFTLYTGNMNWREKIRLREQVLVQPYLFSENDPLSGTDAYGLSTLFPGIDWNSRIGQIIADDMRDSWNAVRTEGCCFWRCIRRTYLSIGVDDAFGIVQNINDRGGVVDGVLLSMSNCSDVTGACTPGARFSILRVSRTWCRWGGRLSAWLSVVSLVRDTVEFNNLMNDCRDSPSDFDCPF